MILKFSNNVSTSQIKAAMSCVSDLGIFSHLVNLDQECFLISPTQPSTEDCELLKNIPGVSSVVVLATPYKLVSRGFKPKDTEVNPASQWNISKHTFSIIAGPCAVENEQQILNIANSVARAGACALRGGAFKPRTSTYDFQGLGEEGLRLLQLAKQESSLPIVSEILDPRDLELYADLIDVVQIGARSMQNYPLLKAVGELGRPVLLKRGMMATVDELLQSAEYILAAGNPQVILCERGIRTFEASSRNTLDLNAVATLKERTHLPVFVDPSHGTGASRHVPALSRAALACGADGLLVEVHNCPAAALSDGQQSLTCEDFKNLITDLEPFCALLGRRLIKSDRFFKQKSDLVQQAVL